MKYEAKYEEQAANFVKFIQILASDEKALASFESYLSRHFDTWLKEHARTPENIVFDMFLRSKYMLKCRKLK